MDTVTYTLAEQHYAMNIYILNNNYLPNIIVIIKYKCVMFC